LLIHIAFKHILGLLQLAQGRLPALLQFGGDQAVVGVGLLVLALGEGRLIAEPFDLLPACPVRLLAFLGGRGHDPVEDVQLRRGQGLEEEADDVVVDRVAGDALTDRDLGLLPERVAQVLRPALVLNDHLVAALAAVDKTVQQGLPRPRDAPGLVPVVLAVVVADHGLDLLIRGPVDVGGIHVPDVNPPLGDRPGSLDRIVIGAGPLGPGPAVDERPGVGRVLEDRADGGDGRASPGDVAEFVAPWDEQRLGIEGTDNRREGPDPEEGGEDEVDAILDFTVRALHDAIQRIAGEPHGQGQCELAALGLIDQAGRQPGLDRMELQFRDLALQAEQEAPVDRGRVVDPVPVADEALSIAAQVKDLIPVGAVP
jgi:hypothetical protein